MQYRSSEGRLFTVFAEVPIRTEWEYREGPFRVQPGVVLPNMSAVTACPFECRWPRLVVELARAMADENGPAVWVLDGDGVVWDLGDIDPDEIVL